MSNFIIADDNNLKIMRLKDLMMVDWDPILPGQSWDEGHTVNDIQEVLMILELDVYKYKSHLWRVYETPSGGVHAFLVSHKLPPTKAACQFAYSLKGDKRYIDIAWERQCWDVRISPKLFRPHDFVAKYIKDIGTGQYLIEHRTTMLMHDTYISKYAKYY